MQEKNKTRRKIAKKPKIIIKKKLKCDGIAIIV